MGLWAEDIPNNQLWYTTSDGNIVEPRGSYLFNVNVVSNTYANGKGVITFDGNLERIEQGVFLNSKLTSVTLPASLRFIGIVAFEECAELTDIHLNEGLDTIAQGAFSACTALTEVSIPASVRVLGPICFYNCTNLTKVYVNWTESADIPQETTTSLQGKPYVYNTAFNGIACQGMSDCGCKFATLYVPLGMDKLYYKSTGWNKFGTIVEDLVNYKSAAIASLEAAKQGVTNTHIVAIADDAIAAINNATSSSYVDAIRKQALADIEKAQAILNDLPTDPEGTVGTAVVVTKGEKSVTLINPDKVTYIKVE